MVTRIFDEHGVDMPGPDSREAMVANEVYRAEMLGQALFRTAFRGTALAQSSSPGILDSSEVGMALNAAANKLRAVGREVHSELLELMAGPPIYPRDESDRATISDQH
ncbi:MAG TPA: hypothetical protein VGS28_03580 [Candidatus Saccharimonadales bacterium]|nr:hypothetical protein [Candidatus Saccharimonadales bacterium]